MAVVGIVFPPNDIICHKRWACPWRGYAPPQRVVRKGLMEGTGSQTETARGIVPYKNVTVSREILLTGRFVLDIRAVNCQALIL